MNIFDVLPIYATKWQISTENPPRAFNEVELDMFGGKGTVVMSDYGYSIELHLKVGGTQYIPVVNDKPCVEGFVVDLTKAKLVTLVKPGEKDVYRIDF